MDSMPRFDADAGRGRFNRWAGILGATAAMVLAGCQDRSEPGTATTPPAAVQNAVANFAGSGVRGVAYRTAADGFVAEYNLGGRRYVLNLNGGGTIVDVTEAIQYKPHVPTPLERALAGATSIAEDLVEAVIDQDGVARDKAIAELDAALKVLPAGLAAERLDKIKETLTSLQAARRSNDDYAVGSSAAVLVRRFVDYQVGGDAPVPRSVGMLDHDGLFLKLLTTAKDLDTKAAQFAVDDAKRQHDAFAAVLPDKNVAVLARAIVDRLQPTLDAGDPKRLRGVADELLAVVDLIEYAFSERAKRAPTEKP